MKRFWVAMFLVAALLLAGGVAAAEETDPVVDEGVEEVDEDGSEQADKDSAVDEEPAGEEPASGDESEYRTTDEGGAMTDDFMLISTLDAPESTAKTNWLYAGGALVILAAALIFILRKKVSASR
jgi:hypothetical protein